MERGWLLSTYIRVINRVGGFRTNLRRVFRRVYLDREAARGESVVPELKQVVRGTDASRRILLRDYAEYTTSVSVPVYAISLQTSSFLDSLCGVCRPKEVLDLGSGFTSFVFRRHKKAVDPAVLVKSVDDDVAWLEKTARFLRARDLSTENLVTLDALGRTDDGAYDLVCYDLGNFETRSRMLSKALDCVKPRSGMIVIDDMDHEPYRSEVIRELQRRRAKPVVIRETTLDQFRRYAWLVTGLNESGG